MTVSITSSNSSCVGIVFKENTANPSENYEQYKDDYIKMFEIGMTVGSCDTLLGQSLLKMLQIQDSLEPCQMDHPCRQHREIIRDSGVNVSSASSKSLLTYADCIHRPNIRAAHRSPFLV